MSTLAANFGTELSIERVGTWKRRVIAIALMAGIASFFWVDSRYPSLLKKYRAGSAIKVAGTLSFDKVYSVDRTMPLATRVWKTSVNWLNTNRVGMTFGFFFAAAALTFLGTVAWRRTRFAPVNALVGAAVGMPLGVCANCVAPIGRAFYASGVSTESVLAAMFSSPTLNLVVLAMTFTLFPTQVGFLKMATVAVMIFAVAPLLGIGQKPKGATSCALDIPTEETWRAAVTGIAKTYAKSFWYVLRVGLPLMLLAAVLGALVAEAVPQNALLGNVTVVGIALVASIGTFLPVPMAFDVVIAYLAWSKGVPLPYVVALLCTLGIYSVYSLSVVGKTISWRVAATIYGAVTALGTLAGLLAWSWK
ncbi:MAG TPA: permease [Candidatus Acidoferrum sp.]